MAIWSTQPQSRFWYFHLLYWLLYLLVKYTHLSLLAPFEGKLSWPYLATYTVVVGLCLLATGLLGRYYLPATLSLLRQLKRLLYWLLPLFLGLLVLRQRLLEQLLLDKTDPMGWFDLWFETAALIFLPLAGWTAVFMLFKANQLYQREFIAQQTLVNQARAARLKVLRYQLNPHFMFNTLNALNSLITNRQSGQAEALIEHLCTFLRHTLKNKDNQLVPLQQEIDSLSAYLAIQQLRFGKRLQINWQLESLPALQVPPLLLQPLAENAVLFTVAEITGPVQLDIGMYCHTGQLKITLYRAPLPDPLFTDSGEMPDSLSQLTERLLLMFGDKVSYRYKISAGVFYTELCLPLEALYVTH